MARIRFEKSFQEATLRSPLQGFREVLERIEVRKDPLTGRRCRINIERARRPKQASPQTNSELDALIRESRDGCTFCSRNIEKMTPTFAGGLPARIWVGEACVLPNLFPFAGFHAVGVFSSDHYLELDHFTPELIRDCVQASLRYLNLIQEGHPEVRYWHIDWNYLPSGGASIVHPHLQVIAEPEASQSLQHLLQSSKSYYDHYGRNYWRDLVETEKDIGERLIGTSGIVSWLAAFAPQGNREVAAVFSDISALAQTGEQELNDLCRGISRILKGYHSIGVKSFNMATFSGPSDNDSSDFYLLNLRMISRPDPAPFYTNDDGFMEKLHHEPIIEAIPEDLTGQLKRFF